MNTRCAVVLTAETDIDALSKSSKLRTLAVYLNVDSLDCAKLKEFQDDELNAKMTDGFSKSEQYMTCHVRFLETHYQKMVTVPSTAKLNAVAISAFPDKLLSSTYRSHRLKKKCDSFPRRNL